MSHNRSGLLVTSDKVSASAYHQCSIPVVLLYLLYWLANGSHNGLYSPTMSWIANPPLKKVNHSQEFWTSLIWYPKMDASLDTKLWLTPTWMYFDVHPQNPNLVYKRACESDNNTHGNVGSTMESLAKSLLSCPSRSERHWTLFGGFPSHGGTPKSSIFDWDFPRNKPAILGYPHLKQAPLESRWSRGGATVQRGWWQFGNERMIHSITIHDNPSNPSPTIPYVQHQDIPGFVQCPTDPWVVLNSLHQKQRAARSSPGPSPTTAYSQAGWTQKKLPDVQSEIPTARFFFRPAASCELKCIIKTSL